MASEAELRSRIRELSDQLDQLTREQADTRRKLESSSSEEIRRMQEKLDRSLEENKFRLDAEYTAIIRKLRSDIEFKLQETVDEICRAEEAAAFERRKILDELTDTNRELKRELEEIKSQAQAQNEKCRTLAAARLEELQERMLEVDKLPHEFFFPNEYDNYCKDLKSAQSWFHSGMFEAAAATADTTIMLLRVFEVRLHDRQHEWETYYSIYSNLAKYLHGERIAFEATVFRTMCGDTLLNADDRNFWSGGHYAAICNRIESAYTNVRTYEDEKDSAIRFQPGKLPGKMQIELELPTLKSAVDEYRAVREGIRKELLFSAARCAYGKAVADLIENRLGYHVVSWGFRGDAENYLDSFDVIMTQNELDKVYLSIAPVRQNGVAVENICFVSVDIFTTPNPYLINVAATGIKSIAEDAFKDVYYSVSADCREPCPVVNNYESPTIARASENGYKGKFDMDLYIRKQTRKSY